MDTLALIGLGSNLGDRKAHLDFAVAALSATPGVQVRAVSSYHETRADGGPGGQGAFLNAAARLVTDLEPLELLLHLLDVEDQAGRVRTVRWGERVLDLDLLLFGCKSLNTAELTVPHPRLAVRRFALAPLAEIAADIVDMATGLTVAQLLSNLDRRPSYLALDAPAGAIREELFGRIVEGLPSVGLAESDILPGVIPEVADHDGFRFPDDWPPAARAKVLHLSARRWRPLLSDGRWLVTDFCLTDHVISQVPLSDRLADDHPLDPRSWQLLPFERWMLRPTFVVALPGGLFDRWMLRDGRPWRTGDVLLLPESSTVEEIAREVLASCASARGG